ncbi:protein of unknown function [Beijerinckiaceae bacterium RH AL1]|jgi:hypothetical protein|nr:protein of unknown function [Beijerinckiaceae bacterium RH CH11]VVB49944.1 protein of unknown function [Beijerinckiaceae bacterium RH AL8]VVC57117.1 protein of unknown function [Beijerinckiaceae bacterium RH AL1]
MKNAENTELVLRRCKVMNCVLEGQSFSLGIMDSELGGRETVEATMKTMSAAGLVSAGRNGTYVLTGAGAEAIKGLAAGKKPGHARTGNWQARRQEAKPAT